MFGNQQDSHSSSKGSGSDSKNSYNSTKDGGKGDSSGITYNVTQTTTLDSVAMKEMKKPCVNDSEGIEDLKEMVIDASHDQGLNRMGEEKYSSHNVPMDTNDSAPMVTSHNALMEMENEHRAKTNTIDDQCSQESSEDIVDNNEGNHISNEDIVDNNEGNRISNEDIISEQETKQSTELNIPDDIVKEEDRDSVESEYDQLQDHTVEKVDCKLEEADNNLQGAVVNLEEVDDNLDDTFEEIDALLAKTQQYISDFTGTEGNEEN